VLGNMGFVHRRTVAELTPALLEAVDDEETSVRANAAYLLAELGPVEAAPVWLRWLTSDSEDLRVQAGLGLKQLERVEQGLAPSLLVALQSGYRSARLHAAEALFRLESVDSLQPPEVLEALRCPEVNNDFDVAETVGWLMARNAREQLPKLARGLAEEPAAVRLVVLKGLYLSKFNTPGLARLVASMGTDTTRPVRSWAIVASAALERSHLSPWVESLTDAFEQAHSLDVRRAALRLLADAGEIAAASVPRVLNQRAALGGSADEIPIEAFGPQAVPHIYSAMNAGKIQRHEGLVWLGKLKVERAVLLIDEAIAQGFVNQALEALGLFGDAGLSRAGVFLGDSTKVDLHPAAIRGLRYVPQQAVPLLSRQLTTGTPASKRAAAVFSAKHGLGALLPELTRGLRDASERVQIASACALVRLGQPVLAGDILVRHFQLGTDAAFLEVVETGAYLPQLLPLALERLSDPAKCFAVIGAIGVLAAQATTEDRQRAIDTLHGVSGMWAPLRAHTARTAARLRRPDLDDPFPTLKELPFS
jgi:HEAT repeat protein